MSTAMFFQCRLHKGPERRVGWVEKRAAKAGAQVTLKGEAGWWTVVSVAEPPLPERWLAEKQRRDRGGLPSMVKA